MSVRPDKVAAQIQKDLGFIFQEYQHNTIITVTNVQASPDLGVAKVYISILGGDPPTVFQFLEDHKTDIRYKLSSKLRNQLRRMPELLFFLDDNAAYSEKLDQLFNKIHKEEDNRNPS